MTRYLVAALVYLLLSACVGEPSEGGDGRPELICEDCDAGGIVELGAPLVGEEVERVVRLRNRGDGHAQVRELQAGAHPADFVVLPACTTRCGVRSIAPGGVLELTIRYQPTAEGVAGATLALGPDGPDLRLVARGGRLACDEVLDFGSVVLGRTRTLALTCSNTSDSPRHLSFGGPTGDHAGEFRIDGQALELGPFASAPVYVAFAPAGAAGARDVQLPLSAGAGPRTSVQLVAEVVEAALRIHEDGAGCIEAGFVQLGKRSETTIEVENVTHQAVPVSLSIGPGAASGFSTTQEPVQIEAGGRATLSFDFEPRAGGVAEAVLHVDSGRERHAICVRGWGIQPQLECDRSVVDFGPTDVAIPRTMRLHCSNTGGDVPGTDMDRLVVEGASSPSFAITAPAGRPASGYAPGETFELEVLFQPAHVGTHTAVIHTNSPLEAEVSLRGEARSYPGCTLEAAPSYDFGRVSETEVRHPFFLTNTGSDTCLVGGFHVTAGGAFSVGSVPASFEIGAGEMAAVELLFERGGSDGRVVGALAFWASDAAETWRTVTLTAHVGTSCLRVQPSSVDFGGVLVQCRSRSVEIQLENVCTTPLTIHSIETAGRASDFQIVEMPPAGTVLAAGASGTIEIVATPNDIETRHAALRITTDAFPEPVVIPLRAHATADSTVSETFTGPRPIDILLVIEDSGADGHPDYWLDDEVFLAGLDGVDWQIGVTTTSVAAAQWQWPNGRLMPVDGSSPRIITPALSYPAQRAALRASTNVGIIGDSTERPLEGMRRALSSPLIDHADVPGTPEPNDGNLGFLRRNADLAVAFMVEEGDSSPGTVEEYVAFLKGLKSGQPSARMHLVEQAPEQTGHHQRLKQAVQQTDGQVIDFGIYIGDRAVLNQTIVAALLGDGRSCHHLGRAVLDGDAAGAITLRIDGTVMPRNNAFHPWRFDAAKNAICFTAALPPIPTTIEVSYAQACL